MSTHLKKFLKIFPGLSLLPPGVVGVAGAVVDSFDVDRTAGDTCPVLDMLLDMILHKYYFPNSTAYLFFLKAEIYIKNILVFIRKSLYPV